MRALLPETEALLGTTYAMAVLIQLDFTEGGIPTPVYVAVCRDSLEWNGHTYIGGTTPGISQIKDQGGELVGISFAWSGVPSDKIALALAEPIHGKRVLVPLAIMRPDDQQITEVIDLWTGTLDQMPIKEEGNTATITISAEHRGIGFARPKGLMYSDADQQRLYPGDRSQEFLTVQASHQDTWPAASWFSR